MKRREFVVNAGSSTVGLSTLATQSLAAPGVSGGGMAEEVSTRPLGNVMDPSYIDTRIDARSISFENPTGRRGAGGKTGQGRKGHPEHFLDPGEKVVLADILG